MRFTQALTFYFRDGRWFRKVLVPAACQFIPLAGFLAATGWALEICRRVIRSDADAVPDLKFRRDLAGGFSVWGILFLYGIPLALWLGLGLLGTSPLLRSGAAKDAAAFGGLWWGIEIAALGIALGCAMGALAAVGRLAETGDFRSAVRIREVFAAVRSAPLVHLQAALAWIPLGLLAALGIAVCGVGVFYTTAYALGSGFHLAGQARRAAAEKAVSGSIAGRM